MRVPKIVPGSTRRRRLAGTSDGGTAIDVEILAEDACSADDTCGPHGSCYAGGCTCDEGWEHAPNCAEGDCLCSRPVSGGACPPNCEHCDAYGVCLTCADEAPVRHSGSPLYLGCTPICPGCSPKCRGCTLRCPGCQLYTCPGSARRQVRPQLPRRPRDRHRFARWQRHVRGVRRELRGQVPRPRARPVHALRRRRGTRVHARRRVLAPLPRWPLR